MNNNTRKQIIELIEPFMDKTLRRGVIWANPYQDYKYFYEYISESKKKGERSIMYYHNDGSVGDYRGGEIKILGHYDITAVLKYIERKVSQTEYEDYNIDFILDQPTKIRINILYHLSDGSDFPVYCWIPNKPLHLYTEQQDKDLLELLQNLGTTHKN